MQRLGSPYGAEDVPVAKQSRALLPCRVTDPLVKDQDGRSLGE